MEPRIQYAKTGDGVSIAYWTLGIRSGDGKALDRDPLPGSALEPQ